MKLKYQFEKNIESWTSEFDVWITPSLGEIQDTKRFKEELDDIILVFEELAKATDGFGFHGVIDPQVISKQIIGDISNLSKEKQIHFLCSFAKVLYLVTAKSDNNCKCQFPIFLKQQSEWKDGMPSSRRKDIVRIPIPRVIKAESFMENICRLDCNPNIQERLLATFIAFVLKEARHRDQLLSIGHCYVKLRELGRGHELLTPLVVFQVRGSVSASGGHEPEELLRQQMIYWGLTPGVDFNITDAIFGNADRKTNKENGKSRAYDFILPFNTPGWDPRIFIQCQFYAGDSGSVSHKNVDQTRKSRDAIKKVAKDPLFVEYVDGAGYFGSLNGDLRNLFDFEDTKSFFQIRSSIIRLRRELHEIGFLTPIDFELELLRNGFSIEKSVNNLLHDGFNKSEIERVKMSLMKSNPQLVSGTRYELDPGRVGELRRTLILSVIAEFGEKILNSNTLAGHVIVPGFGPFWGQKLDILAGTLEKHLDDYNNVWPDTTSFLRDLRYLSENGYIMMS